MKSIKITTKILIEKSETLLTKNIPIIEPMIAEGTYIIIPNFADSTSSWPALWCAIIEPRETIQTKQREPIIEFSIENPSK